ncbi:MAG: NAD-dependent epimerase/dehydratase family protein [Flavobacteriaceae bacterium]|nr:NAD-dependent epimerase/dehydratase family protein [Flavobacteriaceae bacterium]
MNKNILILGAAGQIGSELTQLLRDTYPDKTVVASDIHKSDVLGTPFELLDATDEKAIRLIIEKYQIDEVYLMAAMLSATAEKHPEKAWQLNMQSLLIVLNLAKEKRISKIFWPSSIAVFGSTTPKQNTPQVTITEPNTVYGISKLAGERWCAYYRKKFGVDVRSIRYPGLISWKTAPGGGTTDYAIDIFHQAIKTGKYECFLTENTKLPMMYMDDAIRATLQLMDADLSGVKICSSYNLAGVSFSPKELANAIQKYIPDFSVAYRPDSRQAIADTWPQSIDDVCARQDWNWKAEFDTERIVLEMMKGIRLLSQK